MHGLKLGVWIVSVYLDLEGLIANLATLDSQYQPSKISVDLDNSKLPVLNIASHCITGKMKYVVFSTCWTKLLTTVLIKHLL